ncbi:hypothetical protein TBLA_0C02850 [Henningerozyma blattae CBS 6284]|uniref:Arrestin C-terminal-like domain-containing protein n=1 Tax=Henningerozyma blattae (strain ATCC 34711 / CBS 6284 / DSM 70876 / NBRC 10599 / NRRL Y-10934 / UCD 77-7) TaxID=1071380 RepID=I2H139_HENB6|nr:hypothetical protein TBLA_0C02850 [Tetrapisispora blattae CBS 6284]CCH60091.1 hypothetical protein TBLA_0C02850 [Tetrapisispora blattae CBS 6284]
MLNNPPSLRKSSTPNFSRSNSIKRLSLLPKSSSMLNINNSLNGQSQSQSNTNSNPSSSQPFGVNRSRSSASKPSSYNKIPSIAPIVNRRHSSYSLSNHSPNTNTIPSATPKKPVLNSNKSTSPPPVLYQNYVSPIFPPEKQYFDIPFTEAPTYQSTNIQIFFKLVEPNIFLQGFDSSESSVTSNSPSILRGSMIVRVLKQTKLKKISLTFRGLQRTDWPEGIPPKKLEIYEANDIITHTWPFFNSKYPQTKDNYLFKPLPTQYGNSLSNSLNANPEPISRRSSVSSFQSLATNSNSNSNTPNQNTLTPSSIFRRSRAFSTDNLPTLNQNSNSKRLSFQNVTQNSSNSLFPNLFSTTSNTTTPTNTPINTTTNPSTTTSSVDTDEYTTFNPGDYIFTFEQFIPANYPESIMADYGYVKYFLHYEIQRYGTFKSNIYGNHPVSIIRTPSDMSVEDTEPIEIIRDWENQLHYDIIIASKDIILDAFLPITFNFYPIDKVTLHRVKIYLTETMEYYCHDHKVRRLEPTKKFLLAEIDGPKINSSNQSNVKAKNLGNLLKDDYSDDLVNKTFNLQVFIPSTFTSTNPTTSLKKKQTLHPDTFCTNIKANHWIKICLRLSKMIDGKRKHYEINIDSPIHVLHKLCSHANILLPSYIQIDQSTNLLTNNKRSNSIKSKKKSKEEKELLHKSNFFFPKEVLLSHTLSTPENSGSNDLAVPLRSRTSSNFENNNHHFFQTPSKKRNSMINPSSSNNYSHPTGLFNNDDDSILFSSPKFKSNIYQPENLQRELLSPQAVPLTPINSNNATTTSSLLLLDDDVIDISNESITKLDESPPPFDYKFTLPSNPPTYIDVINSSNELLNNNSFLKSKLKDSNVNVADSMTPSKLTTQSKQETSSEPLPSQSSPLEPFSLQSKPLESIVSQSKSIEHTTSQPNASQPLSLEPIASQSLEPISSQSQTLEPTSLRSQTLEPVPLQLQPMEHPQLKSESGIPSPFQLPPPIPSQCQTSSKSNISTPMHTPMETPTHSPFGSPRIVSNDTHSIGIMNSNIIPNSHLVSSSPISSNSFDSPINFNTAPKLFKDNEHYLSSTISTPTKSTNNKNSVLNRIPPIKFDSPIKDLLNTPMLNTNKDSLIDNFENTSENSALKYAGTTTLPITNSLDNSIPMTTKTEEQPKKPMVVAPETIINPPAAPIITNDSLLVDSTRIKSATNSDNMILSPIPNEQLTLINPTDKPSTPSHNENLDSTTKTPVTKKPLLNSKVESSTKIPILDKQPMLTKSKNSTDASAIDETNNLQKTSNASNPQAEMKTNCSLKKVTENKFPLSIDSESSLKIHPSHKPSPAIKNDKSLETSTGNKAQLEINVENSLKTPIGDKPPLAIKSKNMIKTPIANKPPLSIKTDNLLKTPIGNKLPLAIKPDTLLKTPISHKPPSALKNDKSLRTPTRSKDPLEIKTENSLKTPIGDKPPLAIKSENSIKTPLSVKPPVAIKAVKSLKTPVSSPSKIKPLTRKPSSSKIPTIKSNNSQAAAKRIVTPIKKSEIPVKSNASLTTDVSTLKESKLLFSKATKQSTSNSTHKTSSNNNETTVKKSVKKSINDETKTPNKNNSNSVSKFSLRKEPKDETKDIKNTPSKPLLKRDSKEASQKLIKEIAKENLNSTNCIENNAITKSNQNNKKLSLGTTSKIPLNGADSAAIKGVKSTKKSTNEPLKVNSLTEKNDNEVSENNNVGKLDKKQNNILKQSLKKKTDESNKKSIESSIDENAKLLSKNISEENTETLINKTESENSVIQSKKEAKEHSKMSLRKESVEKDLKSIVKRITSQDTKNISKKEPSTEMESKVDTQDTAPKKNTTTKRNIFRNSIINTKSTPDTSNKAASANEGKKTIFRNSIINSKSILLDISNKEDAASEGKKSIFNMNKKNSTNKKSDDGIENTKLKKSSAFLNIRNTHNETLNSSSKSTLNKILAGESNASQNNTNTRTISSTPPNEHNNDSTSNTPESIDRGSINTDMTSNSITPPSSNIETNSIDHNENIIKINDNEGDITSSYHFTSNKSLVHNGLDANSNSDLEENKDIVNKLNTVSQAVLDHRLSRGKESEFDRESPNGNRSKRNSASINELGQIFNRYTSNNSSLNSLTTALTHISNRYLLSDGEENDEEQSIGDTIITDVEDDGASEYFSLFEAPIIPGGFNNVLQTVFSNDDLIESNMPDNDSTDEEANNSLEINNDTTDGQETDSMDDNTEDTHVGQSDDLVSLNTQISSTIPQVSNYNLPMTNSNSQYSQNKQQFQPLNNQLPPSYQPFPPSYQQIQPVFQNFNPTYQQLTPIQRQFTPSNPQFAPINQQFTPTQQNYPPHPQFTPLVQQPNTPPLNLQFTPIASYQNTPPKPQFTPNENQFTNAAPIFNTPVSINSNYNDGNSPIIRSTTNATTFSNKRNSSNPFRKPQSTLQQYMTAFDSSSVDTTAFYSPADPTNAMLKQSGPPTSFNLHTNVQNNGHIPPASNLNHNTSNFAPPNYSLAISNPNTTMNDFSNTLHRSKFNN